MHKTGIDSARTGVRRSRQSARAIMPGSWPGLRDLCAHRIVSVGAPRRARFIAPTGARPAVPCAPSAPASAGRTLERRRIARLQSRRQGTLASPRSRSAVVQSLAKSAAAVRPLHVGIFDERLPAATSQSLYSVSSTPSLRARANFSAGKTCSPNPIVSHVLMFIIFPGGQTAQAGRCAWARPPGGPSKTSSAPAAATSESAPGGFLASARSTIGVSAWSIRAY